MPTRDEARRGLILLTSAAVDDASRLVGEAPDRTRDALLVGVPEVVSYYSDGTAALAADHYDDLREEANPRRRYTAEPVAELRDEKLRIGVLWAVEPLYDPEPDRTLTLSRLAQVVQYETARPFRQTITANTRRDPSAVGWQRITGGDGCKFCRMLAGRGAVYKQATARFASHPKCDCTAAPVFDDNAGPEASVIQYVASLRKRTPAQRETLRRFLAAMP